MNRELNFTLNVNGWRTHLSDPSNRVTHFGYDRGGRLTNLVNKITSSGTVISSFAYGSFCAGVCRHM